MRRTTTAQLLTALVVGSVVAGGAVTAPAVASPAPAPAACPDPFPVEDVVDGVQGSGLTVERGTVPEPFTADVLGRITDGIAPGVDMIIAELSSPAVDRAGGVWAGMSGSPVYAPDGRLIGAVSYSLAAGSPVAGFTPAEHMLPLVGGTDGSRRATASTVRPSTALAREMTATGEVSAAQVRDGFRLLGVPVRGSVGSGRASVEALERMQERLPGTRLGAGGAVSRGAAADPADIVPGGNYAAALSYGDITFAGVGTTTMVCDGVAVAFGHPLLDNGGTRLSAHTADAVLVQRDPVFGSFKVANPGGVVGTVVRDARTGIAGPLGEAPGTIPVTASFSSPTRATRSGRTEVVLPQVTPDVAALQAITTVEQVYGAAADGTVAFTLTVRLQRADGTVATVRRSDVVSSRSAIVGWPVSQQVGTEVFQTVSELVDQDLEAVEILSVDVSGTASTAYDTLRVTSVEQRQGRTPSLFDRVAPRRAVAQVPRTPPPPAFRSMPAVLPVEAGTPLQVRVGLTSLRTGQVQRTTLAVPVPAEAAGAFGFVELVAGTEAGFVDQEPVETFEELLASLRTRPGYTSVVLRLSYETEDGDLGQRTVSRRTTIPVSDVFRSYDLELF